MSDTTAPAPGQGAAGAGRMLPPPTGIRVRMYRQGLGDCFLLALPGKNSQPFYVLIDCGVIKGTVDPTTKMTNVASDILTATGGAIDVLVATHEHWDHLSGFLQARPVFDKLKVGTVWLAWTEDPTDELANTLRQQRGSRVTALRAAVAKMNGLAASGMAPTSETAERIEQILGFFGDAPNPATDGAANQPAGSNGTGNGLSNGIGAADGLGAARAHNGSAPAAGAGAGNAGNDGGDDGNGKAGGTTGAALDYLKTKEDATVRYCRPGESPIDLVGNGSVRVYVLGPPHDSVMIKRSDPTKSGHEVYELSPMTQETAFMAAAVVSQEGANAPDSFSEQYDRSAPFDQGYHVSYEEAKSNPFFANYYGFTLDVPEAWRRIDGDWLESAGQLALQLDSDTNNTSLAMAIEIGEPGKGKILLFPGDAQVGNWLSWQKYSWPASPAPGQPKVDANDLMARTVLYKVGHHGSHNATLRAQGLEQMTSPDLVAMIPVNHAMAVKKRWNMPFGSLYDSLKTKTRERIMRVDDGQDDVPPQSWQMEADNPRWTNLYVEYTVET